jgi:hypothetical protein
VSLVETDAASPGIDRQRRSGCPVRRSTSLLLFVAASVRAACCATPQVLLDARLRHTAVIARATASVMGQIGTAWAQTAYLLPFCAQEARAVTQYDVPTVSKMITSGKGGAAKVVRGWIRQGRITGARQRTKNAKFWLTPEGVLEAWAAWAAYQNLDPEKMPDDVRKVVEVTGNVGPSVTVIVPAGTTVKVVQGR